MGYSNSKGWRAMEIYYCHLCGDKVEGDTIDKGTAQRTAAKRVICKKCISDVGTLSQIGSTKSEPTKNRQIVTKSLSLNAHPAPTSSYSSRGLVFGLVALVVGISVLVLVTRSRPQPEVAATAVVNPAPVEVAAIQETPKPEVKSKPEISPIYPISEYAGKALATVVLDDPGEHKVVELRAGTLCYSDLKDQWTKVPEHLAGLKITQVSANKAMQANIAFKSDGIVLVLIRQNYDGYAEDVKKLTKSGLQKTDLPTLSNGREIFEVWSVARKRGKSISLWYRTIITRAVDAQ